MSQNITREQAEQTDAPTVLITDETGKAVEFKEFATFAAANTFARRYSESNPVWVFVLGEPQTFPFGGFGPRHRASVANWRSGRSDWK